MNKQKKDRYEMHKYWGKKPSKDLNQLIHRYSKEGDVILDPFSGYGVFCCEALMLNRNVISNDLNPIANFINEQLLNRDIDLEKLNAEWKIIKSKLSLFIELWFSHIVDGQVVELINVLRDKNDKPLKARYRSKANGKIKELVYSGEDSEAYLEFEQNQIIKDWYPTNLLIENSRISAKKGMSIADVFTKRTLACHARLFTLINELSSGREKDLLKLAFTANLANCSKLVPPIKSRGDMSQGAWMTGFYIGDTYLENNVLLYFENRVLKTIKGKKEYLSMLSNGLFAKNSSSYQITSFDAKCLKIKSNSIDYVFTDPPYGDAVPYFEQSILWNSWLKLEPDYENEIVISDSKNRKKDIKAFSFEIEAAFLEIRRVLKPNGFFSLTYHSLSGLEWRAITNACIKNGFEMVDFTWLVQKSFTPRQINRLKSIKGDILITFVKAECCTPVLMNKNETEDFLLSKINEWLSVNALDTNEILLKAIKLIFEKKLLINDVDLIEILIKHFRLNELNKWILDDKLELCAAR